MEETSTLAALSSFLLHCVLQANKMFACRQFSLYLNILVIKRISIKLFTDSMFWYNSSSIINAAISSFRISLTVHFICIQSMKIPPIWTKRAFLRRRRKALVRPLRLLLSPHFCPTELHHSKIWKCWELARVLFTGTQLSLKIINCSELTFLFQIICNHQTLCNTSEGVRCLSCLPVFGELDYSFFVT